jgi:hypothetical protein
LVQRRAARILGLGCAATVVFLIARDLFVPHVRDTEVWFGFELTGRAARLTAPIHWAIFGVGAWGFWNLRSWIWPWASVYAAIVAASHLIWNLSSPSGGGWCDGLWQFALFGVVALWLLRVRPASTGATP